MASIGQIRGALLEEIVLHLLENVGYRIVNSGEDGTKDGSAGLEIQGRGEWHQADALASFDYTPAFMYPLRIIVEAKCYADDKVGIGVVRNSVGVLCDVTENYFTHPSDNNKEVKVQRFNYHSAIFSSSGYTEEAQRYAIAHQIFLIQYQRIPIIRPVIDALISMNVEHFMNGNRTQRRGYVNFDQHNSFKLLRKTFRKVLKGEDEYHSEEQSLNAFFTEDGKNLIRDNILHEVSSIKGSYYGMLQGKYPVHLLSNTELPSSLFMASDEILCKIYHRNENTWAFVPTDYEEGHPNYFELQFDLPEEIAKLIDEMWGDFEAIANAKRELFSFVNISGKIDGIRRQVQLRLDEEWLTDYIESVTRHQMDNPL
jgi:hypothetical protein